MKKNKQNKNQGESHRTSKYETTSSANVSKAAAMVPASLLAPPVWQQLTFWLLTILGLIAVHFHDQRIFQRKLIDYDDEYFILPLKDVSFANYFSSNWYNRPENFPFALKDYSFLFDFKISEMVGFNTFWLTNFLLYVAVLFLVTRIWRHYLNDGSTTQETTYFKWLPECLLVFVAFHPVLVEAVQWASNRKHLLVAFFVALGTLHAVRLSTQGRSPRKRDWFLFFSCYTAGWLTWPSISLWMLWVLYKFRNELKRDSLRWLWIGGGVGTLLYKTIWAFSNHTVYAEGTEAISSLSSFVRALVYGIEALGRATASFVLPYRLVPYYKLNSIFIWLGLTLFVALTIYVYKKWSHIFSNSKASQNAKELLLLFVLLFAPQGTVFLTFPEFVWADRYFITGVSYLSLFLLYLCLAHFSKQRVAVALVLLGLVGGYWGSKTVPHWQSEHELFTNCAMTERTPKCVHLAIEKRFDDTGCAGLDELFKLGRDLVAKNELPFDTVVQMEVPLYESLCVVSSQGLSFQDKMLFIQDIKNVYKGAKYVAIAESLAMLQDQQRSAAVLHAMQNFFDTQEKLSAMPKIINILRGFGNAICTINQLYQVGYPECQEKLEAFHMRTQHIPVKEMQTSWGMNRTIAAANGQ